MELPNKILQQTAFNTRSKFEEHLLIVMDKSTPEQLSSQPLQTTHNQFNLAITFLSAYNGFLMLQIQILSFILRNKFPMEIILSK